VTTNIAIEESFKAVLTQFWLISWWEQAKNCLGSNVFIKMDNFANCDPLKTCRTCLIEHGAAVPLFTFNYDNARPSELLVFCTTLQASLTFSF
jgi:hypothetical protein